MAEQHSEHTYRIIEIVGTSTTTVEDAIRNGLARVSQSIKGLDWFEVAETRGRIENGTVGWFQVTLRVGFRILDDEDLKRG